MLNFWEPSSLGIEHLNVARSLGCSSRPLPLVKDGDLIALAQYMIRTRGRDTVRVTKVKGHAVDADVDSGRVRLGDISLNLSALLNARNYWSPIMQQHDDWMIAFFLGSLLIMMGGEGFCP